MISSGAGRNIPCTGYCIHSDLPTGAAGYTPEADYSRAAGSIEAVPTGFGVVVPIVVPVAAIAAGHIAAVVAGTMAADSRVVEVEVVAMSA